VKIKLEKPLLTIGLLVYNKGQYIESLLNEIIRQIEEGHLEKEIELVVSDNASTDGTERIMRKYLKWDLPFLRYNRNRTNLGFSGNILKEIELARGDYLWFMGDDEIFKDGIFNILQIIKKYNHKERIFLMSIANIYPLKTKISNLKRSYSFILRNGANMSTTIIPTHLAKNLRVNLIKFNEINQIWTHNQFSLLLAIQNNLNYVLINNVIFKYMTRLTNKVKPNALVHVTNKMDYYDLIYNVDKKTGSRLFNKLPKFYDWVLYVPFLDAFNPNNTKVIRKHLRVILKKYRVPHCYITKVLLLVPHSIRKYFANFCLLSLGMITSNKKYSHFYNILNK